MEILPVVDESDAIIEYRNRKDCHNEDSPILHREVHVIVFNKNDKFLLQKRSESKKQFPGYWTNSATGHVSKGEEPIESAFKEVEEELGFVPKTPKFLGKHRTETENNRAFIYIYTTMYDGEMEFDEKEVDEIKFLDKKSILEYLDKITPACKSVLEKVGLLQ